MSFYNTVDLHGAALHKARSRADSQNHKILTYMASHPHTKYTPSEIYHLLFSHPTPITSVRRSMNTLTKKGHLVKLGLTDGPIGYPEHYWQFVKL